jgi:eukaryotic-like serine/threonine-protein kinase
MTPRDLTGALLGGRYRVLRLLGSGGMGAVYEAVQEGLGRRVAVKVVYDELATIGDAVARFQREALAAAALGHPNIVAVTDFQLGPPPFLVMELLEGASLQQLIARGGALPVPRVVHVAAQLLSALAAAHRAGLVHRDVKPDNVFLTSTSAAADIVKLLDFGVVKQAGDPRAAQLTATGAMVGSPAYMSPEQIRGRAVDPRTDVYGVGVCMYNALTGRMPFHASSLPELVFAIDEKTPPPILQLRPDAPPGLALLVERAMAKGPAARFGSADEMLAALAPWTGFAPGPPMGGAAMVAPMRSEGPPPQGFSPTAPPQPAPYRPPTAPAHQGGGSRALIVVGALVVLAAVASATAWAVIHRPEAAGATAALGVDGGAVDTAATATSAASPPRTAVASASSSPPTPTPGGGGNTPHGGGVVPPPPPPPVEDAGALDSIPTYGRTLAHISGGGNLSVPHLNFVVARLMPQIDQCAKKTPNSELNQGTAELTLFDIFDVAVDAGGATKGVTHPTDSFSHTFDACVRPLLLSTNWGKVAHSDSFALNLTSRRSAH